MSSAFVIGSKALLKFELCVRFDRLNGGRFDRLNANGVLGRARAPFALSLSKRTHGTVHRPIFKAC